MRTQHAVKLHQDALGRPMVLRLNLTAGRFTEFGRTWIHDQEWIDTPSGIGIPRISGGSGLSQYAESHIVDHSNGKTSWTMPAGSFMALCTATVTSTSTGSTITEANYTGYARATMAGNWTAATAATPSVGVNTATLTFAACTAGTSTVTFFALCDASTVGNMIWWGTISSTVISTTQTPATVAASALTTSLT